MTIDIAVIPVAGLGSRLLPLTKALPKEMLPIGNKPVIQHIVDELTSSGLRQIHMVTSASKSVIVDHFDHNQRLIDHLRLTGKESQLAEVLQISQAANLSFTRQPSPLGLGHAVLCAADFVGDRSFLLALGDAIIDSGNPGTEPDHSVPLLMRMQQVFERHQADAVIAFQSVPKDQVSRYGIASPGPVLDAAIGAFAINRLVEKPTSETAPSQFAICARYLFKSSIMDCLRKTEPGNGSEIQLTDAIQRLIDQGGRVVGVPLTPNERRFDIGNISSYYEAVIEIAMRDPDCANTLRSSMTRAMQDRRADSTSTS